MKIIYPRREKELCYLLMKEARLCGCDTIHNQNICPMCSSKEWVYLKNILDREENYGANGRYGREKGRKVECFA